MAGYSGTPLAKKLGIKAGHHVALVNAPPNFEAQLQELPADVAPSRELDLLPKFDVIILFAADSAQMRDSFGLCKKKLAKSGGLWVAWYKQSCDLATDLNEDIVREFGLAAGLVDNKVCAIDNSWSGLRFVVRLKDRK
jgi:3-hydroxyisobutyrate dehydrogenase-like beta-hydroxyacid dehydrogenase